VDDILENAQNFFYAMKMGDFSSRSEHGEDFLDWEWLTSRPAATQTSYLAHIYLDKPFTLKVDGRRSCCVMFAD
jgi:hypothetical protein